MTFGIDPYLMKERNLAKQITEQVVKHTEHTILSQLNELISRGLLVVEQDSPILVKHSERPNEIEVRTQVRLLLKDQEYIVKLEKENAELKKLEKENTELKAKLANTEKMIQTIVDYATFMKPKE